MTPEEMKRRSRGFSRDMSPEAIARRINIVSELRALMIELGKAKIIGPVKPYPPETGQAESVREEAPAADPNPDAPPA